VQPVTSSADDRIYFNKIVTGKGARIFLITVCLSLVHARRFRGHLLTRSRLVDFLVRSALLIVHISFNVMFFLCVKIVDILTLDIELIGSYV
jgi:hypothetical protein